MLGSFPSRSWLGWIFWASLCAAQNQASPGPGQTSLEEILQLAKAHRYAEAASAIRRVPEPKELQQQIAFLRLRASIESGLGDSKAAATDMEAAAKLAPNNSPLQAAAALARLEARLADNLKQAAIEEGQWSEKRDFSGTVGIAVIKARLNALPWASSSELGWTAGFGVEVAMIDNWTAKAEYLAVGFQEPTCGLANCFAAPAVNVKFYESMVRVGVNYKFGY